jgi:signal transduction histidine kinase
MTNAAKFAGVEEIDVYAEVTDEAWLASFVRDRGAGSTGACPGDRRGSSSRSRADGAAGGSATVDLEPGEGTEVELHLPRRPS